MPAQKKRRDERDPQEVLLEYVAGVLSLARDAEDGDRVEVAARVGLPTETAARILGKTATATQKALERARKKHK